MTDNELAKELHEPKRRRKSRLLGSKCLMSYSLSTPE
jgi:hypothetical protein